MPWTAKTQRLAQAVRHGFHPTGSAKGFTASFADQVVEESKALPTKRKVKKHSLGNIVKRGAHK